MIEMTAFEHHVPPELAGGVDHTELPAGLRQFQPIRIPQSAYLKNRIEQDHRAIKKRVRAMLDFHSVASARVILGGIEMIHLMRKQQAKYARNPHPSLAEQFEIIAA